MSRPRKIRRPSVGSDQEEPEGDAMQREVRKLEAARMAKETGHPPSALLELWVSESKNHPPWSLEWSFSGRQKNQAREPAIDS